MTNPFIQAPSLSMPSTPSSPPSAPTSTLLTEKDFASIYAAADFAFETGVCLDTSISIVWRLMGPQFEADAQHYFRSFTACARDWLKKRGLPACWIYAHEVGRKVGLHTHLVIWIPGFSSVRTKEDGHTDLRAEFRKWCKSWVRGQVGGPAPRAIRVRGSATVTPWLHWLLMGYLLKGYDPKAVVQSGRRSPDEQDVLLGDLIPFPWHDPGCVPLKQQVGTSRSLGPEARAARRFRTLYEDGHRDVRVLYGYEFFEKVTRVEAYPPEPRSDEERERALEEMLATISL